MIGLLAAFGLFSVLPVPMRARTDRVGALGALSWLPLVGAALGALAFLPALAVWRGHERGSPLLAGVLIVLGLALLTRGLHLDGAADLADGLGSRRPADEARAIMRRPEVGAFGLITICGLLLAQAAALATLLAASSRADGVVLVIITVATGRLAAVRAGGLPASDGSAFGALVAGIGVRTRLSVTAIAIAATFGLRAATGGPATRFAWLAAAVGLALVVGQLLGRHAVRRLGGVSGDVFGALIELSTTAMLVVLAAETAWQ